MEPTGHYWFNLANWLADKELHVVMVNPASSADDTGCIGGQGMRNRGTIRKYSPGSSTARIIHKRGDSALRKYLYLAKAA